MFKLKVNNIDVEVEEGLTVLQACEKVGVEIPRFCYHEKLSIAGNCRMCLVEMEKSAKPVASCAMPAAEGMNIKTNTEFVKKARKGVMEFLLANHPLDCPVCDQGGECDLQDQSMFYGIDKSRFKENKREVPEKNMGPLIKTQMTRCIHCTRCIRFATEVAGVPELGAIGRGEDMQITTYLEQSMQSELSANVVDLCPVGALTSKPYVFEARPWELKKTETIDVMDAVGSNIRVDTYGWEVKRILPRINEDINEEWISDKTRYACDGLLNQRLDTPFIKYNGKFDKASWKEVYNIIQSKIKSTDKEKICGISGDLTNMETLYAFKEFFNKCLNSSNIESRSDHSYLNTEKRENYLFNSTINNIEESDFIFLIGTNPRYEATILNARIRKSYLQKKTKIISLNNLGDLTYPYSNLNGNTDEIKEIIEDRHEISEIIKNSKKPLIILGQSILSLKSGKYIFESIKSFLKKNDKISEEWNSLNLIYENAATIGSFDLGIYKTSDGYNQTLKDLENHKFKIIYLLGQDSLKFKKQNEFIIYQGSHGDKGAEIADIILPGAAYTEQNGYYTNLEGKLQKAYKASYPPGEAKEDWKIINDLSELINHKKLFKDKEELESSMINYINLFKKNNVSKKNSDNNDLEFISEKIIINKIDYYYSNVIARASKTMSECRNEKINMNKIVNNN
jgi:NADH-quinone oxidoreductase subunit G